MLTTRTQQSDRKTQRNRATILEQWLFASMQYEERRWNHRESPDHIVQGLRQPVLTRQSCEHTPDAPQEHRRQCVDEPSIHVLITASHFASRDRSHLSTTDECGTH